MKFILENRNIYFDFQYELFRAEEYYRWLNEGKSEDLKTEMIVSTLRDAERYDWEFDPKEWCPVGSVEFCVDWYKTYWGKTPLPRNVPEGLSNYLMRRVITKDSTKLVDDIPGDEVFRKHTKIIKSNLNGIVKKKDLFNEGEYDFQISEVLKPEQIISEWRCFVYNGALIDIKNYAGDPFHIPQKEIIAGFIHYFSQTHAPISYTLDVGIIDTKGFLNPFATEVIEVHDFFSCGLYGFSDLKLYPLMLWRWFKEFTTTE